MMLHVNRLFWEKTTEIQTFTWSMTKFQLRHFTCSIIIMHTKMRNYVHVHVYAHVCMRFWRFRKCARMTVDRTHSLVAHPVLCVDVPPCQQPFQQSDHVSLFRLPAQVVCVACCPVPGDRLGKRCYKHLIYFNKTISHRHLHRRDMCIAICTDIRIHVCIDILIDINNNICIAECTDVYTFIYAWINAKICA